MKKKFPAIFFLIISTSAFAAFLMADDTDPAEFGAFDALVKERAAGMEQSGDTRVGVLENRGIEIIEISLERGCHTFIAAGEPSVIDLSMSIKSGDKEVASNRTSSRLPVVTWCAGGNTKVKVVLEMYNGRGAWKFGVYKGTTIGLTHEIGGGQKDFMSTRIKQLYRQFGKKRTPISALLRDNLKAGEERSFDVKLVAERCYTVIVAADPHVRKMSVSLIGPDGKEIILTKIRGSFGHLDTEPCIKKNGNYKIKVKVLKGAGQLSGQLFSD